MIVRAKPNFLEFVEDDCLHPTLGAGREYYVIEISNDYYRIVDDKGDPILFPRALFDTVVADEPSTWLRIAEEDYFHCGPREIAAPGFFEDFFGSDGDVVAEARNQRILVDVLRAELARVDERQRLVLEPDLARLLELHPILEPGFTGRWTATVAGLRDDHVSRLEIHAIDDGFLLFAYVPGEDECISDTCHMTLHRAKRQATWSFGVSPFGWKRVG